MNITKKQLSQIFIFVMFVMFICSCKVYQKSTTATTTTEATITTETQEQHQQQQQQQQQQVEQLAPEEQRQRQQVQQLLEQQQHQQKDIDLQTIAHDKWKHNKPVDVKILYGTDRMQITDNNKKLKYANDPAYPGTAKYEVGYTIVSAPPNHITGVLNSPSLLEFKLDTLKHFVQKKIKPLSSQEFNQMLLGPQYGESAFIFVHGYNTSFEDAALRTAQLACDIQLPIAPIMFSWSSNDNPFLYSSDEDRVDLAIPAFIDFLKRVALKGHFRKIHLIAHSMGNRLVGKAMLQMANENIDLKIDQVIMAAPDIYVDQFKVDIAEAIAKKSKHTTVYSANNDLALMLSKIFHNDTRLGEIGKPPPLYVFNKLDVIDSSTQKFDMWGHDRFARSPEIISDMNLILRFDYNAEKRGVHIAKFRNNNYYSFP